MKKLSCFLIALGAVGSISLTAQGGSVVAAGNNADGQSAVPAGLTDVVGLSAGSAHSVAVRADGTAVAWGYWGDQRLEVPADLTDALSADAGVYHTLVVRGSGAVGGWGFNGEDILSIPEDKLALGGSPVVAVAAGRYHSLAVKGDGTVVGWGFREHNRHYAPPELVGVVAIDAGRNHSLALKHDGTVVAWGDNADGQGAAPEGLSGVTAIAAGGSHNLALKADGTVTAWGNNDLGQSSVPGGLNDAIAIAAGADFSLALRADGTVVGWGDNSRGQRNVSGWSGITAIAAGGSHSLGLLGEAGAPTILSQPQSQTVLAGSDAAFSVEATGDVTGYQWQYNGSDIDGATGASLSLAEVGRAHAGVYSVTVSASGGSVQSRGAVLLVRRLHQLASPQLVGGSAVKLSFGDRLGESLVYEDLSRYVVQVSEDLVTWQTLDVDLSLVDGSIQVAAAIDPEAPGQFYRVVER